MAMTGVVKDELSRVPVTKPCCRKAEVSTLLRFAGGLTLSAGHIVIEAELDTAAVARRLRAGLAEVFGHTSELLVLAPGGLRKGSRYVVRVAKGGDSLARQAGLIDSFGRPVRGLPKQVVAGGSCDCEAAWRGAFLVHGSLTEPGRSMALEITCPGSEAALALVGARAAAEDRREGAGRAGRGPGGDPGRRRDQRDADPARARTTPCWPGRSGGCAARCGPPPTGWPTSTTRTCAARRGPRWRPARGWSGRWRSSARTRPSTWSWPGGCVSLTARRPWRNWASSPTRRSPRTRSPGGSAACSRWPTAAPWTRACPHRGVPHGRHAPVVGGGELTCKRSTIAAPPCRGPGCRHADRGAGRLVSDTGGVRYLNVDTATRISKIRLGTWQFGSGEWGYGKSYAEQESQAIVRRAIELGVTLFDTAEIYGLGAASGSSARPSAATGTRCSSRRRSCRSCRSRRSSSSGRSPARTGSASAALTCTRCTSRIRSSRTRSSCAACGRCSGSAWSARWASATTR